MATIILFQKEMVAPSKKCYNPKSVYWYQCFSVLKMVGAKSLVHSRLAGPTVSLLHRLTLPMHVSQKSIWQMRKMAITETLPQCCHNIISDITLIPYSSNVLKTLELDMPRITNVIQIKYMFFL